MKKTEKHIRVLQDALKTAARLQLSDAISLLDVSESTARRLFSQMEQQGLVIRVHGGIQPIGDSAVGYRYDVVENQNTEAKRKIGAAAAELVENGDVVFLDSGTTLGFMSAALARRLAEGGLTGVTVFTNSLVNLHALAKVTEVTLIGGRYRDNRKDFCGYVAEEAIRPLRFTKCFLGTDGYSPTGGFAATDFSTAQMSELVFARSQTRILLADASKFTSAAMVGFSKGKPIQYLITDKAPVAPLAGDLTRWGTQVKLIG